MGVLKLILQAAPSTSDVVGVAKGISDFGMMAIAAAYMDKHNRLHHLTVFQTKFETLKTLMRIAVMKREKYHIGGKTLVMTESNGVMVSEWVDNNNINNKNN